MKFMIYTHDKDGALDIRMANRDAHLAFLRGSSNVKEGDVQVISAGPWLKNGAAIGSLLVVEAGSIEAVMAWNKNDPYVLAGLTAKVTTHPLGGWTNF
ncbi:MAG: YciI family protein [Robiginitomaculum sp.]|nr:YciI family protein [Robiginitomaculum sp.]